MPPLHLPLFSPFFFNDPATTEIYTLSLHDALPIFGTHQFKALVAPHQRPPGFQPKEVSFAGTVESGKVYFRSEEHTSELQSRQYLVCRLLLEKKKKPDITPPHRRRKGARRAGSDHT